MEFDEAYQKLEAGEITQAQYDSFLDGEELAIGDTDKESGETPASTEEEAKAEDKVETVEEKTEEAKPETEEEKVVLAADGKHTIPFSEFKELRDTVKELREQNSQLSDMLKENKNFVNELKEAQQTDQQEGTTEATDSLLADLEEDYPGITKKITDTLLAPLQSKLDALEADKQAQEKAKEEADAATQAKIAFDNEVEKHAPNYRKVADPKNDDFWNWFDKAPAYVKSAQQSGDPEVVASVIKLYESESAAVSDTTEEDKKSAKVKEAIEKAESKSSVNSLSDIPGGSNPASDKFEAFFKLPENQQVDKLLNMTPEELEKHLARSV